MPRAMASLRPRLDELVLWVHPVLAGIGTANDLVLSQDLTAQLTLLDARPLTSGVVVLSYQSVPTSRASYVSWAMEHLGDAADAGDGVDTSSVSIMSRRDGATGVVVLSGELDLHGGDAAEVAVAALLAEGVTNVTVEAGGLSFIDSSGLGGLLAARALVVDAGGEFRVGPVSGNVARIIDVAGVSDLLGPQAT